MLAERLSKAWRARQASVAIDAAMRFAPEGLVLGAQTVLAPAEGGCISLDGDEARLSALLAAAHLRAVDTRALNHIRKAAQRWSEGRAGLAQVHLALSGLELFDDPRAAAQRLFLADGLMNAGIEPRAILKALDLDPSGSESLAKDYRTQPRVPKGSGRPSGQWTSEGDDDAGSNDDAGDEGAANLGARLIPARYDAKVPAVKPNPALPDLLQTAPKVIAPAAARPWFLGLTGAQLGELALFALRFGGPAAAFSTLFIPLNKSLRQEGTIPGWPPIHFLWYSDQRSLTLSYLGADGRLTTTVAELGEDGVFRDVDKKPIGRVLPDGSVMIAREALLPKDDRDENERSLCKKPELDKDHKNVNGLLFENHMKALVNPGNPTPSGFGIRMFNPVDRDYVYFDDCQRRSGILFEYKGVTYAWLFSQSFGKGPMDKLVNQAKDQVEAAQGEHIVWVFAEEAARVAVEKRFDDEPELKGRIQLISERWRPGKRT